MTTTKLQPNQIESSGWYNLGLSLVYSSSDSPVFVANAVGDVTSLISNGYRIKLTQNGSNKYFIVHGVGAFSSGTTPITLYGGTDYVLYSTGTINTPQYSNIKAPFNFPLNPTKWTVEVSDIIDRVQLTPTINVWYNLGSMLITIPIGVWKTSYSVILYGAKASPFNYMLGLFSTLSTANNSETDVDFTGMVAIILSGYYINYWFNGVTKDKTLTIASKTVYYLLGKYGSAPSLDSFGFNNASQKMIIRAIDAYL